MFSRRSANQMRSGAAYDRDPVELALMVLGVLVLIGVVILRASLLGPAAQSAGAASPHEVHSPHGDQPMQNLRASSEADDADAREATQPQLEPDFADSADSSTMEHDPPHAPLSFSRIFAQSSDRARPAAGGLTTLCCLVSDP